MKVVTNVSEERSASVFRIKVSAPKMEGIRTSETLVNARLHCVVTERSTT
jgi:hypothetical protein